MKFVIRNILFLFNLVFVLGLGLAYLSPYVSPEVSYIVGFFGLTFKAWLLANIALLILWLMLGRKLWFYNLIVLLAGFQIILRDVQFNPPSSEPSDLNVMFFNTRVLQVYNNGNTSDDLGNYLASNDLDIAVFVEWLNKKGQVDENLFPYQQFVRLQSARNRYDYGLKLVSKHKILHWERVEYGHVSDNMTAFFDIEVGDEVIRVVATHLQSNSLGAGDYHKFLDFDFGEESKKHAKTIVSRIRWALGRRAIQTRKILQVIEDSPYPVLIMGDFNDTPQSYAYQRLKRGRKDAFMEAGRGMGTTYLEPFPLLRIDCILFDDYFKCVGYSSSTKVKSDHKIIEARFQF